MSQRRVFFFVLALWLGSCLPPGQARAAGPAMAAARLVAQADPEPAADTPSPAGKQESSTVSAPGGQAAVPATGTNDAQSDGSTPAPALTGRVVDDAHLLKPAAVSRLNQMLAAHESATGEQLVVVTVPSLNGRPIEEFGYQLGRRWGIGQKGKDNGALLIVARDEHKVRIEVGYGLEGELTDAISSAIINQIIVPAFRQGNFDKGIVDGSAAIIKVLGGDAGAVAPTQNVPAERDGPTSIPVFFILLFVVFMFLSRLGGRRHRGILPALVLGGMLGNRGRYGGGGFGGGFGGGGGFTGGGGGFGGGGASGNW